MFAMGFLCENCVMSKYTHATEQTCIRKSDRCSLQITRNLLICLRLHQIPFAFSRRDVMQRNINKFSCSHMFSSPFLLEHNDCVRSIPPWALPCSVRVMRKLTSLLQNPKFSKSRNRATARRWRGALRKRPKKNERKCAQMMTSKRRPRANLSLVLPAPLRWIRRPMNIRSHGWRWDRWCLNLEFDLKFLCCFRSCFPFRSFVMLLCFVRLSSLRRVISGRIQLFFHRNCAKNS